MHVTASANNFEIHSLGTEGGLQNKPFLMSNVVLLVNL